MMGGLNEWGEIRHFSLNFSKAHDQFMPEFGAMAKSLEMHGLPAIEAVYTDNVQADKSRLEKEIPSLTRDVVRTPNKETTARLEWPPNWTVSILTSSFQINSVFNSLMELANSQSNPTTVGFSSLWPVDLETGTHSRVALLQIAYNRKVYLVRVSEMVDIIECSGTDIILPSLTPVFLRKGNSFSHRPFSPSSDRRRSRKLVSRLHLSSPAYTQTVATLETSLRVCWS